MNTVLVDIKEQDLVNYLTVSSHKLSSFDEQGHEKIFKQFPFTLYKKRMIEKNFLTIQIPLDIYCLFFGNNLVK